MRKVFPPTYFRNFDHVIRGSGFRLDIRRADAVSFVARAAIATQSARIEYDSSPFDSLVVSLPGDCDARGLKQPRPESSDRCEIKPRAPWPWLRFSAARCAGVRAY
jgi:hypothetical protein